MKQSRFSEQQIAFRGGEWRSRMCAPRPASRCGPTTVADGIWRPHAVGATSAACGRAQSAPWSSPDLQHRVSALDAYERLTADRPRANPITCPTRRKLARADPANKPCLADTACSPPASLEITCPPRSGSPYASSRHENALVEKIRKINPRRIAVNPSITAIRVGSIHSAFLPCRSLDGRTLVRLHVV